jgi:hypothetical protein
MACDTNGNSTLFGLFQWSQVLQTLSQNISCGDPASIRPDVGGSLIPWPLTVLLLLLHLPAVVVRIAMWERALSWSLVLTAFEAGIALLAFISSRLAPEKVMVWSTVVLVISAGAMLQQFILLAEKHRRRLPLIRCVGSDRVEADAKDHRLVNPLLRELASIFHRKPCDDNNPGSTELSHLELGDVPQTHAGGPLNTPREGQYTERAPLFDVLVMIASALLFFCIIALQIRGLVAAIEGRRNDKGLEVSWCSPIFNTFSVAVQDGNCNLYRVYQVGKKGVGCIKIPANEQKVWLAVSIVLNLVFLVVEGVDFVILVSINAGYRLNEVKMKRPWGTMFSGIIVLLAVLAFGAIESFNLPDGITKLVRIVMRAPPSGQVFICTATLTPAGLRGQVISWTDGLLSSWGSAYYGTG